MCTYAGAHMEVIGQLTIASFSLLLCGVSEFELNLPGLAANYLCSQNQLSYLGSTKISSFLSIMHIF